MNKLSRIASFVLIIAFTALLSAVAVSAEGSVTLSFGTVELYEGDTVFTVPVAVSDNSGIINVRAEVAYDSALTLTDVTTGDVIETSWCSTEPDDLALNPYPIYFSDATRLENITSDGVLVYLTFTLDSAAQAGTKYALSLENAVGYDADVEKVDVTVFDGEITVLQKNFTVTFKDWDGDVIDEVTVVKGESATAPASPVRAHENGTGYVFAGWDTSFDNVSADITVTATYDSFLYGDTDGNGIIAPGDSVLLSRYSAGWAGYGEENVNKNAADVNTDGAVTPVDGVIISRFLAGWAGYKALPV